MKQPEGIPEPVAEENGFASPGKERGVAAYT